MPQTVTVFGDRAFKRVIKVKWGLMGGPWSNMTGVLIRGDYKERPEERPGEDTGRRWPSTSQGKHLRMKATLLTPWSYTTSLHNCEEINVCCVSSPTCGTLWRPWPANTAPPLGCRRHCSLASLDLRVVGTPAFASPGILNYLFPVDSLKLT